MYLITISGYIELQKFITKNGLSTYEMVNLSIGNDDKIYCLFTENIPSRIKDMFEPTINNSIYKAASFDVNWTSGEIYSSEVINFGLLKINYHFIQPIEENYLLLGARAMLYKDGETEKNALIIDRFGNKINEICLGDGIQNCLVDSKNNIITGYFDEGIFGNYGWDKPIGENGIIKWSCKGEKLWENKSRNIYDCYAMNIDDKDILWFYYYDDFYLVKTDYISEVVYNPKINGSDGFLLSKMGTAILFQKGYDKKGFCTMRIKHDRISEPTDCKVTHNGAANAIDILRAERKGLRKIYRINHNP